MVLIHAWLSNLHTYLQTNLKSIMKDKLEHDDIVSLGQWIHFFEVYAWKKTETISKILS